MKLHARFHFDTKHVLGALISAKFTSKNSIMFEIEHNLLTSLKTFIPRYGYGSCIRHRSPDLPKTHSQDNGSIVKNAEFFTLEKL